MSGGLRRWMVNGRMTTILTEAKRLEVNTEAIKAWMARHRHADGTRATLAEAVAYYEARRRAETEAEAYKRRQAEAGQDGARPRGRPIKRYAVDGEMLSIGEAARRVGVAGGTLREYVRRSRVSVQTAVDVFRVRQRAQAEREIMATISGD